MYQSIIKGVKEILMRHGWIVRTEPISNEPLLKKITDLMKESYSNLAKNDFYKGSLKKPLVFAVKESVEKR